MTHSFIEERRKLLKGLKIVWRDIWRMKKSYPFKLDRGTRMKAMIDVKKPLLRGTMISTGENESKQTTYLFLLL